MGAMTILFKGRQLMMVRGLKDYGIKMDATMSLVLGLKGGARGGGASSTLKPVTLTDALNPDPSSQTPRVLSGQVYKVEHSLDTPNVRHE